MRIKMNLFVATGLKSNKVDAFFEAIDADDFGQATTLMKRAGIDFKTMDWVLKKMRE